MMSKRQRTSRALFQRSDPCQRCADETKKVVKCACGKSYCEGCLREVISEWVILQDQTNPYSTLVTVSQLGDGYEDLPEAIVNDLRYHHLFNRIRECSNCLERTLCPKCAVFGYYQRCELCKYSYGLPRSVPQYSNVCPKCVSEGVLVPSVGMPSFEMFNPFMGKDVVERVLFGGEGEREGEVGCSSSDTALLTSSSVTPPPMMLWRCKYHLDYVPSKEKDIGSATPSRTQSHSSSSLE